MSKKLFMAVTADKYEFPLCISESLDDLSKNMHVNKYTIKNALRLGLNGKRTGIKFVRVEVDEDDV